MTEISITVTIANRNYPLKINLEEKAWILKAVDVINARIKELEMTYGVKDKQDYLAMCALQSVVEGLKHEGNSIKGVENLDQKIDTLDELLDGFLENN